MAYDGNIYKKDSKFRTTFGKHDTDSSPQKQFLSTFVKCNTGSSGFRGGGGGVCRTLSSPQGLEAPADPKGSAFVLF